MIILKDIEALQQGKIDKTQIINGLGETEIGKVLDATQGKILNDRIDVLNRLCSSSKVNLVDNSLLQYVKSLPIGTSVAIQFSDATDAPTVNWYYADIQTHVYTSNYANIVLYDLTSGNKMYIGSIVNNEFKGWQQIATTDNISNPNLLINGDFQVWQRGTSFSGYGYTADRWRYQTNSPTENALCEKTDKGFKLTAKDAQYVYHVVQPFETETSKKLLGKTVTLSAKINFETNKDNVHLELFTEGMSFGLAKSLNNGIFYGTFNISSLNNNLVGVTFGIDNAVGSIEVEWIKLEIGSVATPFTPRPYAEELAMCQRYYECGDVGGARSFYYTNGRNAIEGIKFKQQKRIKPTLAIFSHPSGLNPLTQGKVTHAYTGASLGDNVVVYHNSISLDNASIITSTNPLPETDRDVYAYYWTADAELY